MGLTVYIYRNDALGNCTNGPSGDPAITGFTITNVEGPFEPCDERPAAKLLPGHLPGTARIVPESGEGRCVMFGGNYAATCDSRFNRAVESITGGRFYGAVPIHDRIEY